VLIHGRLILLQQTAHIDQTYIFIHRVCQLPIIIENKEASLPSLKEYRISIT